MKHASSVTHNAGRLQHRVIRELVNDIDLEVIVLLPSDQGTRKGLASKDCGALIPIGRDVSVADRQVCYGPDGSEAATHE